MIPEQSDVLKCSFGGCVSPSIGRFCIIRKRSVVEETEACERHGKSTLAQYDWKGNSGSSEEDHSKSYVECDLSFLFFGIKESRALFHFSAMHGFGEFRFSESRSGGLFILKMLRDQIIRSTKFSDDIAKIEESGAFVESLILRESPGIREEIPSSKSHRHCSAFLELRYGDAKRSVHCHIGRGLGIALSAGVKILVGQNLITWR